MLINIHFRNSNIFLPVQLLADLQSILLMYLLDGFKYSLSTVLGYS